MARIIVKIRDNYVKKDNTASVYLQLFILRQKVTINTGISIPVDHWDYQKNQVKGINNLAKEYNLVIDQAIGKASSILANYQISGELLTPEIFKAEYNDPGKYTDFYQWVYEDIEKRRGIITDSTITLHYSVLSTLRKFKRRLKFSEVDHKMIQAWEKHLIINEKNSVATVSKKLRTLKAYINRAKIEGRLKTDPFRNIKIRRTKGRLEYLSDNELKRLIGLYNREGLMSGHRRVLRYFLFSCFTGLRLGDVKRLSHDMIIGDTIVMVPKKKKNTDNETVKIPLCKSAKVLIKDTKQAWAMRPVFDTLSDQKTNEYLKDCGELVKIKKNMHFHLSRHTFATLFLEKTGDLATLQKLMGHASITQTMIYAHVSETKKKKQIKVFDNYLQS
jgi:integrase/recombinase XerD